MSGIASIANRSSAPLGDTPAASSPGLGTPQFTPAPAATPAALATPAPVAPEPTPAEPVPTTPAPAPEPEARAIPASLAMKVAEPANDRSAGDWIDQILRKMMRSGSSDVHLSSGSAPYWRVDGNIEKIPNEAEMAPDFLEEQIRRIAPEENWEEFGRRNDTDFAYEVKGLSRFRVNVFRDRKGVGTVMRTIPFDIPSAEALGLPKAILDMANLSKGLVLVTGPTGSGKSTTLAALIDYINENRRDHLITIEDPIEFVHPNKQCLVNQREIRRHTNSFKDALRAALREDPDIVMVGEMRDLETIEIAVETAETGHLVFGTLHTTTAPSTVDRIIDQFPTDRQEQIRQMLATSLKGVISQVLCRKKGGGRVAAHEILVGTPAVSNLIRESKTFQLFSLMQTGRNLGMLKMEDSLLKLVQDDLVEPLEAYRKANNKQEFATMLQRAGYSIEAE
ncbi:MAG: type IV pilus twitching motility protein PilT [Kofleriaceae bacterium]|nr:type IV pilus twitching motility protein PilT [Kofleriaceae bacterium]